MKSLIRDDVQIMPIFKSERSVRWGGGGQRGAFAFLLPLKLAFSECKFTKMNRLVPHAITRSSFDVSL